MGGKNTLGVVPCAAQREPERGGHQGLAKSGALQTRDLVAGSRNTNELPVLYRTRALIMSRRQAETGDRRVAVRPGRPCFPGNYRFNLIAY